MPALSFLWERKDTPGLDACRLELSSTGARLRGNAVFLHEGLPAALNYDVTMDSDGATQSATVEGFIGDDAVSHTIRRAASGWMHNGKPVPSCRGLDSLDLSFTPATNFCQFHALKNAGAETTEIVSAWFDLSTQTLKPLPQNFTRIGETSFQYAAPSQGYEDVLEFDTGGMIARYPGLWDRAA